MQWFLREAERISQGLERAASLAFFQCILLCRVDRLTKIFGSISKFRAALCFCSLENLLTVRRLAGKFLLGSLATACATIIYQRAESNDMTLTLEKFSLERTVSAVEKVRARLLKATAALNRAGVEYAVVGGNAVAAWVTRVDEAAVRNTRDVDILLRRADLVQARQALEAEGFVYRHAAGLDIFLDAENATARDSVHIVFANEQIKPHETVLSPDVTEAEEADGYRILSLEALVRVKLTAWRDKDRTHLRDLIDVGLLDENWVGRFPPELVPRLQFLLDTPEG